LNKERKKRKKLVVQCFCVWRPQFLALSSDEFRNKFVQVRNSIKNIEFEFRKWDRIYSPSSNSNSEFDFIGPKSWISRFNLDKFSAKKFKMSILDHNCTFWAIKRPIKIWFGPFFSKFDGRIWSNLIKCLNSNKFEFRISFSKFENSKFEWIRPSLPGTHSNTFIVSHIVFQNSGWHGNIDMSGPFLSLFIFSSDFSSIVI
jgi:hypothetical protein